MRKRSESWTQRTRPILSRLPRRPRTVRRFLPASAGLLTLLLVASGKTAQPSAPGSLSPLVREADDYYLGRWRIANVEKGLALLRQETLARPRDYEAWWRIAEFDCYWVRARHNPANPKILLQAIAAAKRATALAPTRPEGHFWLGIAYGLYAERENLLLGLRLVGRIRRQMRLVEKLDPSYQQCGAQRTLARVDERLPFFAGGNQQRAIQLLQDCLKKYPHDSLTMLYLAEGLLAVGQSAAAQSELQAILRLCPNPNYGPEQLQNQAKARALLAKRFAQKTDAPSAQSADSSRADGAGAARHGWLRPEQICTGRPTAN